MVDAGTWFRLVGGFALLLANGVFVTTEFALTRIPQFPREELTGNRGLERAAEMTDRLEIYLSGCQVGITIASVGLGVVAEPAVSAVINAGLRATGLGGEAGAHAGVSVLLALAVINGLHVIVGEQAPTYLGVERTLTVATYLAPVLYWWTRVMAPFIRFADWVAKALLSLGGVTITRSWQEAEGEDLTLADVRSDLNRDLARVGFPEERREEVLNAIEIQERSVSEILIPRDEMVVLHAGDPRGNLEEVRAHPQHNRFPLFDADDEEFLGIVYATAVLAAVDALRDGETTFEEVATPPMSLPADTTIDDAIDRFQAAGQELAVVVDDGRVVGLVTASDAFEAIAGDLEDPLDRLA